MRAAIGLALAFAGYAATYQEWVADGAPDDSRFDALDIFELWHPEAEDLRVETIVEVASWEWFV